MNKDAFDARVAKLLAEEKDLPTKWWYISFADDDGFLGGVVIKGKGFTSAIMASHRLGINPGGEAMGIEIPPDHEPPESAVGRLLSRAEVESFFGPGTTLGEYEAEEAAKAAGRATQP
jgi:hypothetical protein